jgi:hypothetical protein
MTDPDFDSPGNPGFSHPDPVVHMEAGARVCTCSHDFPICAGDEQLGGVRLLHRSRWLSSLAGWPARVTREEAAGVVASHGRPVLARQSPPSAPAGWPAGIDADEAARVIVEYGKPMTEAESGDTGGDCGCS